MLKIAICDDSDDQVQKLHLVVSGFLEKNHEIAEISTYTHSSFLRYDIQEGKFFDLILTDIEMPQVNGMELAETIRHYLPYALVIFVTAYIKYAVDAFELSVFRYVPKDKLNEKLSQALLDAVQLLHMQAERYYTISEPSRFQRVPLRNILYIRREGKNSIFHLTDNSTVRERCSLAQVLAGLNSDDFIFSERGCIVNLIHIVSVHGNMIEMKNGAKLSISHARLKELKTNLYYLWRT